VKKVIAILILIAAGFGGGVFYMKTRGDAKPAAADAKPADAKPADDEPAGAQVTRDENGRVVIKMNDETQGNMGLKVAKPEAAEMAPEFKGFGRVLDPAPLASLITELVTAQAAYAATSNELIRLKTLAGQGNATARALQTAEATEVHDQLVIQSAKDRLALSWGKAVAKRDDLPAFVQSLVSLDEALVRIDLPAGEDLNSPPSGARIANLSGKDTEAGFFDTTSGVDPQIQGRGFIFLIKTNALRLLAGEAVTGYLKVPGAAVPGAMIPRDSVIRTEGAAWVYVMQSDAESFTRVQIPLDHPTDPGWFVTKVVSPDDYVVTAGAQTLLSEELKPAGKPE
jgi:multidrug efflux system membrane fusion protein